MQSGSPEAPEVRWFEGPEPNPMRNVRMHCKPHKCQLFTHHMPESQVQHWWTPLDTQYRVLSQCRCSTVARKLQVQHTTGQFAQQATGMHHTVTAMFSLNS
jgi:hypothetical protein